MAFFGTKDLEPLLYESDYQWIRPILYFLWSLPCICPTLLGHVAETVPVSYTLPLQMVSDPFGYGDI